MFITSYNILLAETNNHSTYDVSSVLMIQCAIRRYTDSQVLQKLQRKYEHRKKVLTELKETEEIYVGNLEVLMNLYYEPLAWKAKLAAKSKSKTEPILDENELAQIFGNVAAIRECNKNLLNELSTRLECIEHTTAIGDVFVQFVRVM